MDTKHREGDAVLVDRVDNVEHAAHVVTREDHELSKLQTFKQNPKAMMWCFYAIWVLVLASFDNAAGSNILSIPQFRKDFGYAFGGDYVLPGNWQSAYSGAPAAFTVISSLGAGYIADRIGRKLTFLVAFLVSFLGITLEVVATTNELFFAGKSINGIAIGLIISVGMTYVGEIVPTALRGSTTAACAIAFAFGPFIGAFILLGTGSVDSRWAYRSSFVAQYGFNITGFIFLPLMPESPWWLVSRNREDAALKSLSKLGYSSERSQHRLANIKITMEQIKRETEGVTYFECFRKSNLRRTIISIAPLSIQALCGVIFVAGFGNYYLQLSGYTADESFKVNVGAQILSMSGNVFSWFLVDRVGRRNLTLYGLVLLTVILAVTGGLASTNNPACIKASAIVMVVYAFPYNATIGATAYVLLTEIATSRLRIKTIAIGLALQNALFTLFAFTLPFMFNPDQANLGGKTSFIFVGLSVVCIVYIWWYQPETSRRTYEEIDELFVKRVPARAFKSYITEAEMKGQATKEGQSV